VLIDKQTNKNLVLYSSLILREPIENAYLQDDFPEPFLPLLSLIKEAIYFNRSIKGFLSFKFQNTYSTVA
jgi:hypothetical protein